MKIILNHGPTIWRIFKENISSEHLNDRKFKTTKIAIAERKKAFLTLFKEDDKDIKTICTIIGISSSTVENWKNKDMIFACEFKSIQSKRQKG